MQLSATAFAVSWYYAESVENMPSALFVPLASDPEERARQYVVAMHELRNLAGSEKGLEEFGNELEAMYVTLSKAPTEYFGWCVRDDGTNFGIHVAKYPQQAVLAMLDEDLVEIRRIQPDAVFAEILAVLPEYPVAQFRPVNASADALGIVRDANGEATMKHTPRGRPETEKLREILNSDPKAKGQLNLASRDAHGRRRVGENPLSYLDLPEGRVLLYGTDGGQYLTACPATPQAFAERLGALR